MEEQNFDLKKHKVINQNEIPKAQNMLTPTHKKFASDYAVATNLKFRYI